MYEAIVVVRIPETGNLIPGTTGALLDRDRVEMVPGHLEMFRLVFESESALRGWLAEDEAGTCTVEKLHQTQ